MTLAEFETEALTKFTRQITDRFFCYIENDRDLMYKYLSVIGRDDSNLDQTNTTLGMAVKKWFELDNSGQEPNPKSKLIKSYTIHRTGASHAPR